MTAGPAAITLEQAQAELGTSVDSNIYNELRKSSEFMNRMTFKRIAAEGEGTFTHTFKRNTTQPEAEDREINDEYTKSSATVTPTTVECGIFGGAFNVDEALSPDGRGKVVARNMENKVNGIVGRYSHLAVNGEAGVLGKYDGLNVLLTGSATQEIDGSGTNWYSLTNETAWDVRKVMNEGFYQLASRRNVVILTNRDGKLALADAAARASAYTTTPNAFGEAIEYYRNAAILDLGSYGDDDIIETREDGTTDFFIVELGTNAYYSVTPAGRPELINIRWPNMDSNTSVNTGRCEIIVANILQDSRGASVIRNVQVRPEGS